MKFSLKDHPYLLLFCVALLMLACSLAIGFVYGFSVYAIVAIVISALGSLVLFVLFLKDLIAFRKNKESHK